MIAPPPTPLPLPPPYPRDPRSVSSVLRALQRQITWVAHMLWPRPCSPPAVLQAWQIGKKNNSFMHLGVSFIRTALAKTAMTSPALFFFFFFNVWSVTVCPALLAWDCCWPRKADFPPCAPQGLFYWKRGTQLACWRYFQVCADVSVSSAP